MLSCQKNFDLGWRQSGSVVLIYAHSHEDKEITTKNPLEVLIHFSQITRVKFKTWIVTNVWLVSVHTVELFMCSHQKPSL